MYTCLEGWMIYLFNIYLTLSIALNGRMIVNHEWERMWKEMDSA
jgi:hypothetical protein